MGKARSRDDGRSKTLPSSPSSHHSSSSSSSSSDFEFTISLSPHKSSFNNNLFCPADELFFKGQILPLHLTPRLSMVQTLSLSSSNSTSATSSTTASRDSTASSTSSDFFLLSDSCDSSRRPSSVTEEEEHDRQSIKRFSNYQLLNHTHSQKINTQQIKKPNKYFSLARFSNVFRKETKNGGNLQGSSENNSVKRMSKSAKEMMRKYMKKVKPFYEKLSSNTKHQESSRILNSRKELNRGLSQSFSENVRYPRRKSNCVSSCPSSMRSSPNRVIGNGREISSTSTSLYSSSSSSMEELQNAIQGAIAHCKNSMTQNKKLGMITTTTTSKEI